MRAVAENTVAGGSVGDDPVTATDGDEDVLTYSLSGGADKAAFTIDQESGQIRVGDDTKLDFEGTQSTYTVEVKAEDPFALSDVVVVIITVTDVDEPPVLGLVPGNTAPRFAADGSLTMPAYVTVVHNGLLVQNHVEIAGPVRFIGEPYYQPHALRQPLQLQDHRNPVSFRNIWIREMWPGPASPHIALSEAGGESDWQWLFDGSSLDKWREFNKHGPISPAWVVEAGVLAFRPERKTSPGPVGIIAKEQFADFELELEWKISPGGNSGIFFHVTEHEGLVRASRAGLEMQILDDGYHPDAADPDKTAGAAYDLYAPARAMTSPVGEWNLVRIVSIGGRAEYWLNGEKIVEFDRDSEDWRQRYAASKFLSPGFEHFGIARRGHIGLQDHDDVVFFRNIRIRRL